MPSQFRKILRQTVFAALAGLGLGGTAHAALVVGVFDPDFGGPLTGTNYSGTATFSISQSCLDLNLPSIGVFIPAFLSCGSGGSGMEFLGAHVEFPPACHPGQTGAVDFAASTGDILGMYVRDHQVIGVWSKVIGPEQSTLPGGESFDLLFGPLLPPPASIFIAVPGRLDRGVADHLPVPRHGRLHSGGATNACEQSNPATYDLCCCSRARLHGTRSECARDCRARRSDETSRSPYSSRRLASRLA